MKRDESDQYLLLLHFHSLSYGKAHQKVVKFKDINLVFF